MSRRSLAVAACAAAICAVVAVLWIGHLESNRMVKVGNAVAVVEGRDLDLSPWNDASIGVGIGGRLELVGGRCVGFLGDSDVDRVIVWPPGTKLSGPPDDLRISSEGKTVRLGQEIDAGNEFGHDFAGIKRMLPRACRHAELVQVGLSS
jgi:hypothetical protein